MNSDAHILRGVFVSELEGAARQANADAFSAAGFGGAIMLADYQNRVDAFRDRVRDQGTPTEEQDATNWVEFDGLVAELDTLLGNLGNLRAELEGNKGYKYEGNIKFRCINGLGFENMPDPDEFR